MIGKKRIFRTLLIVLVLTTVFLAGCDLFSKPKDEQVAKPTFNPPGGDYSAPQIVGISCATAGATIRYTTDGTEPTAISTQYTDPIRVDVSTTIKAKGFKENWKPSATVSATYTITPPGTVASPTFNPPGGSYSAVQNVEISCATTGATIRYTIDGTEPTESSTKYIIPITLNATTTIKAKGFKTGLSPSTTANATYNITLPEAVAVPTFSPPEGSYSVALKVQISCATPGASIHYTFDGSEPTPSSNLYVKPIPLNTTTSIRARAFKNGLTPSPFAHITYNILVKPPAQMIHVPGGTFIMGRTKGDGSDNELPAHSVTVNSFYIGNFTVTQSEWQEIMGYNHATEQYGLGDDYPIYKISWFAILKYCNLRSMAEGLTPVYKIWGSTNPAQWGDVPNYNEDHWGAVICNWDANGYRLPTEAEWEYAARGASNEPDYLYSGSDNLNNVSWNYTNNTPYGCKPVGLKYPNGLGIYDMSGNIYEYCWDLYRSDYYSFSPSDNPTGPGYGELGRKDRVVRGGFWYSGAQDCRVVHRLLHYVPQCDPTFKFGFRVCRTSIR